MKIFFCILFILPCYLNATAHNKNLTSTNQVDSDQQPYHLITDLPKGYVKDASVDYTAIIQKAVNQHDHVILPAFPILVNDKGINIGDNKTIVFLEGAKLILKPSAKPGYNILNIHNVSNVTLINPVIVGDRDNHIGTEGQWGAGISIVSAKNIVIKNAKVSNCWGDGIYIARDKQLQYTSQNIQIIGAYCNNNRRNGISVISVSGLKIMSTTLASSNGHSPESGIDIEPNKSESNFEVIEKVVIQDLVTENNKGDGVLMDFCNYYGLNKKPIDVLVENHRDNGSSNGSRIIAYKLNSGVEGSISGNIAFVNTLWGNNSKRSIDVKRFTDNNLKLSLKGLKTFKNGNAKVTESLNKSLIETPKGALSNITITP